MKSQALEIRLGDQAAGSLRYRGQERTSFQLFRGYRERSDRCILGQQFEDDLHAEWKTSHRLPAFFSNLLPEGKLLRMIAREFSSEEALEFKILRRLGMDLPGNVYAFPERSGGTLEAPQRSYTDEEEGNASHFRFALAGVQPKLSLDKDGKQLVLPIAGQGGHWIAKLPMLGAPGLTRLEFSMMEWAAQAGFEVPERDLVSSDRLPELGRELLETDEEIFLIRRFDRLEGGRRVHFEDFAQVLGLFPDDKGKYKSASYPQLTRLARGVSGEIAQRELARRLVFMLVSGNGDAHTKNWALIYRDGVTATLSPMYDQVPTVLVHNDPDLALNLTDKKNRAFRRVGRDAWRRFAKRAGLEDAEQLLDSTVESLLEAWDRCGAALPLSSRERARLRSHWAALPILWGRALPEE